MNKSCIQKACGNLSMAITQQCVFLNTSLHNNWLYNEKWLLLNPSKKFFNWIIKLSDYIMFITINILFMLSEKTTPIVFDYLKHISKDKNVSLTLYFYHFQYKRKCRLFFTIQLTATKKLIKNSHGYLKAHNSWRWHSMFP